MANTRKKKFKLEEELEKLEGLVQELESGKLSLDDSLKHFEQGLEMYKNCKSLLNEAEKKITLLSDEMKEESYSAE